VSPSAEAGSNAPLLEQLAAAVATTAGRELGRGYQASVRLYDLGARQVVVKMPHRGGPFAGLWRRLLRREHAVYAHLADVPGIPRALGLVRGELLAIEYVAGPSLREHDADLADRDAFFERLLATVRAMHAAGVAHGDLKRKANVIVGSGEQPYLIDFGIACRRSATSALWNRWFFEPLKQLDLNAWVKLKYGRRIDADSAASLSSRDAQLYRPLAIERLARAIRVPWQKITLRRPRQRWRARRESRHRD
jgi:predicted Ser/Thr protein kinase